MENKSLKMLALTFFASGIWDTVAAMQYFLTIGTSEGQIMNPGE